MSDCEIQGIVAVIGSFVSGVVFAYSYYLHKLIKERKKKKSKL